MKYFKRNNVISNFNTLFYNTFLLIIQEHDSGYKEKKYISSASTLFIDIKFKTSNTNLNLNQPISTVSKITAQ
jgi:hypothetical protein